PQHAAWYIAYVLMFNLLVGPVFSAGSITSERERQTLDLLLTTLITPWQMLWGKLFSGLRVSSVLTGFLLWPVVLACILPSDYWSNLPTMGGYLLIVAACAITTAMVALFCSTLFRKSATALMASYLILATLFLAPSAANVFTDTFLQDSDADRIAELTQITSPFAASFNLPLNVTTKDRSGKETAVSNVDRIDVRIFWGYLGFSLLLNGGLLLAMSWLFNVRWRVSE
ncbi:MAG: ABC transporter permease subunit, partial [Lacipirellulaceae bacterium]